MTLEKKKPDEFMEMPKIDMKDMDFGNAFQKFLKVIKLDKKAIVAVSEDKKGGTAAAIFLVIGAIGSPLGSLVFGYRFFNTVVRPDIGSALLGSLLAVVMAALTLFVTSIVAVKLFKGHGSFPEFFRVAGLAYGLSVLYFFGFLVPSLQMLLGLVVGVWMLVISFVTIKQVFKLDDANTVLTMIVTVIVFLLLGGIITSLGVGGAMMGMGGGMPNMSITY